MNNKFADMTLKDKTKYFGRMVWDELPIVAEVRDVLGFSRQIQGTSLSGNVSLIHGIDGIGKSVACDHYFRKFANIESGTYNGTDKKFGEDDSILDATWVTTMVGNQERRSCIKIDVSPRVTANGLLADMIRGLTSREPPKIARHDHLLHSIKKILVGLGTEVLVLDNAHRAVERNISVGKSDAGDIIAEIAHKTGVEIVLVGTDLAMSLFDDSKELSNHARRYLSVAPLPFPNAESKDFLTLLSKFQNRLPFPRRSDLTSDEVCTRLYAFCQGNIEVLAIFLQSTVSMALHDSLEFVDLGVLGAAYDRLYGSRGGKANPFKGYRAICSSAAPGGELRL